MIAQKEDGRKYVGWYSALPVILCFVMAFGGPLVAPAEASSVFLRVNQVGYFPMEGKVALSLTDTDLTGKTFQIISVPFGTLAFAGKVGHDRGVYGSFAHLYELDFSALTSIGRYRIRLGNALSPPFVISKRPYANTIRKTLKFYPVQRCGKTSPVLHGSCHLKDGIAEGGPANGTIVDVAGGWHDAGDYLKFVITTGTTTLMMLTAFNHHPPAFEDADGNGVPDVLDEAQVGLNWMLKMWDSQNEVLYYQVGDATDHDVWRLPEKDDSRYPRRKVWPCTDGKGANVAGKVSASLALAAALWADSTRTFHNPTLAAAYLQAAKQIYSYGKKRPDPQSSIPSDFYEEVTWTDDMALAAAELYRATGEAHYLQEARSYAIEASNAAALDYDCLHGLAHFEIAQLDPSYRSHAVSFLKDDLSYFKSKADAKSFRSPPESSFQWGSAYQMLGAALEACWYRHLTGETTYEELARNQRDYLLGCNPWGVCMVNGIGSIWPKNPHHQVSDLTSTALTGFWAEGPIVRSEWSSLDIELEASDKYAPFQSGSAVYHDDMQDYATNEPTITINAFALSLMSWYAFQP